MITIIFVHNALESHVKVNGDIVLSDVTTEYCRQMLLSSATFFWKKTKLNIDNTIRALGIINNTRIEVRDVVPAINNSASQLTVRVFDKTGNAGTRYYNVNQNTTCYMVIGALGYGFSNYRNMQLYHEGYTLSYDALIHNKGVLIAVCD